jgi:hypothetical protein
MVRSKRQTTHDDKNSVGGRSTNLDVEVRDAV